MGDPDGHDCPPCVALIEDIFGFVGDSTMLTCPTWSHAVYACGGARRRVQDATLLKEGVKVSGCRGKQLDAPHVSEQGLAIVTESSMEEIFFIRLGLDLDRRKGLVSLLFLLLEQPYLRLFRSRINSRCFVKSNGSVEKKSHTNGYQREPPVQRQGGQSHPLRHTLQVLDF
jgi:hypothetical protein